MSGQLLVDLGPTGNYDLFVFEILLGVLLIAGWVVVRLGHVRAHRAIQSAIVLGNIPIILVTMVPPYLVYGLPKSASELSQSFYLYPALMLVAGAIAEVLGVYIVLVAGTNWIPSRWRFRRYKLWMRTELILWWVVLLTGIATYYYWWVAYP
jgi:uncharacterized membrane protein YozB (DUF420 family)